MASFLLWEEPKLWSRVMYILLQDGVEFQFAKIMGSWALMHYIFHSILNACCSLTSYMHQIESKWITRMYEFELVDDKIHHSTFTYITGRGNHKPFTMHSILTKQIWVHYLYVHKDLSIFHWVHKGPISSQFVDRMPIIHIDTFFLATLLLLVDNLEVRPKPIKNKERYTSVN